MEILAIVAVVVIFLLVVVIRVYIWFSKTKKKRRSKEEIIPQGKIESSTTKAQKLKSESDFYSQAWDEINDKKPDSALWAKAFSVSQGDEKKTQAKYIELRVVQLQEQQLNSKAEGTKPEFQPTFSRKAKSNEPESQPTGKAVGKKGEDRRGDVQPKSGKLRLGRLLSGLLIGGVLIVVGCWLTFVGWDEMGLNGELYNITYPVIGWVFIIGGGVVAILGIIGRR
jgi:hypothetical protein